MPVAWNCRFIPVAKLGVTGLTVMETIVAGVTVSSVLSNIDPMVAEMEVDPAAIEETIPFDPTALLMVAFVSSDDAHVTAEVRFWVEVSV